MSDKSLKDKQEKDFIKLIDESIQNKDVLIVADYGHGLLTDLVINHIIQSDTFLAVNTQANAGNRGFNTITRYSRADFITMNGSEARLETRRKHDEINSFAENLMKKMNSNHLLITKGADGVDIYESNKTFQNYPALAPFVKDRVGAGDLVLVMTSLLSAVSAPSDVIGFYANVVGAWSVTFTGNEKNIEIGTLSKLVKSILA